MLPKKLRLNGTEIHRLIKHGKSIRGKYLLLKYENNSSQGNRASFSVAKKLRLNSVARNKLKRSMSHAFSDINNNFVSNIGSDFFVILLAIPDGKVYQLIYQELSNLIVKTNND